jgi:hypothetical protein
MERWRFDGQTARPLPLVTVTAKKWLPVTEQNVGNRLPKVDSVNDNVIEITG